MSIKPLGPRSKPEMWTHGRNCYANHGCRCDRCRDAVREYQRQRNRSVRRNTTRRRSTAAIAVTVHETPCSSEPAGVEAPRRYQSHDTTWDELVAAAIAEASEVA